MDDHGDLTPWSRDMTDAERDEIEALMSGRRPPSPAASEVQVSAESAPTPGKRVVHDRAGGMWAEGENRGWFSRRADGDTARLGMIDDAYGVARVESAVDGPPGPVAEFLAWLIDLDDPAGRHGGGRLVSLDEIIRRARIAAAALRGESS